MGTSFSKAILKRIRRKGNSSFDEDDYEQILTQISTSITQIELSINTLRGEQLQLTRRVLIYGILSYLIYLTWIFFLAPLLNDGVSTRTGQLPYQPLLDLLGVIFGPFLIWYCHKLVRWWYGRHLKRLEKESIRLIEEQKDKVEELKRKTFYYKTKGILERFEKAPLPSPPSLPNINDKKGDAMDNTVNNPIPITNIANDQLNKGERLPSTTKPINEISVPSTTCALLSSPLPSAPPSWLDKLVDALIGDDRSGGSYRYALICQHCQNHNGLIPPEEYDTIQYICPRCNKFNPPKKILQPNETLGYHSPALMGNDVGNVGSIFFNSIPYAGSSASVRSINADSSSMLPMIPPSTHHQKNISSTFSTNNDASSERSSFHSQDEFGLAETIGDKVITNSIESTPPSNSIRKLPALTPSERSSNDDGNGEWKTVTPKRKSTKLQPIQSTNNIENDDGIMADESNVNTPIKSNENDDYRYSRNNDVMRGDNEEEDNYSFLDSKNATTERVIHSRRQRGSLRPKEKTSSKIYHQ